MGTQQNLEIRLAYQTPYRFSDLLDFYRIRILPNVEYVGDNFYARTARIPLADGAIVEGWIEVKDDPAANELIVAISESLEAAKTEVAARIRRQFDIDCDPEAVYQGILSLNDTVPNAAVMGTRSPGCFEPFETACRAVLGQQISVSAANKIAGRIVENFGAHVDTERAELSRAFPTPADVLALESIESAFGELGVIKTRSRVIHEIARLVSDGELDLVSGTNAEEQMKTLLAIKGVGPWTANYIAMRVIHYPDAFLESDIGVKHALPGRTPKEIAALAEAWRPYRSYANICLWNSLSN